jgi:hypothetical protein
VNELPAPPQANQDPQAVELLRAWIIDSALQCVLQSDAFEAVDSWGEVLADLIYHIARAQGQQQGADVAATVQRLRGVIDEELRGLLAPAAEESGEAPKE